ncbi:tRNA pseudouridine(55) synthase TruB [Alicyclobacillus sp. SO9]|uniref:tRNA pseudouridine(55) synthase TruB n=1 Tax=Alicyclobacillus sp. SO9 TaxID=2665646 RepID=UPI0018E8B2D5|nr:tRNA pseudouridine(55) synthase TruB [Alicyclobacillus sp. SO9]QQE80847.1 tRNA pseudouridine(55) synthase TruB [Alicyclobacillus sp. SO9]
MGEATGVLLVNKPKGMTSHDVVNRVRRVFRQRKVGHAGTLDPDATGVLVLCLGYATRVLEYLTADDKEYEAQIVFGTATDTDDATGEVIARRDASALTESDVMSALGKFQGVVAQRVPAYSSVHIQGKRAYERARAGEDFTLPERTVTIYSVDLRSFSSGDSATGNLHVACSKGTYIRSLCRDIGEAVGVPAHMGALNRTRSGVFSIEKTVTLEELETSEHPERALQPVVSALSLSKIFVEEDVANRLSVGQRVWVSRPFEPSGSEDRVSEDRVAVVYDGALVAISEVKDSESDNWLLQPVKVFWKKDR